VKDTYSHKFVLKFKQSVGNSQGDLVRINIISQGYFLNKLCTLSLAPTYPNLSCVSRILFFFGYKRNIAEKEKKNSFINKGKELIS